MSSLSAMLLLLLLVSCMSITMSEIWPVDQATVFINHMIQRNTRPIVKFNHQKLNLLLEDSHSFEYGDDHLVKDGLPGQPDSVIFKQYAGNIVVDESNGKSLFYYFVESPTNSTTKPLILWLNGGPGCSSLGLGAFTEIGPFGVNPDGETLYNREFAWNQVANVLFLESPAGVGFSYSNTTSEYIESTNHQRTAEDTYIFLMKWFHRYPAYKGRTFYLIGEGYAGYYIPELADFIMDNQLNAPQNATPVINLKGIMIGNGLIDDKSDTKGLFDNAWISSLIGDEFHEELRGKCPLDFNKSLECRLAVGRFLSELGNINIFDLYRPQCGPDNIGQPPTHQPHPCDAVYTQSYLNSPDVQVALHANTTKLPYPWQPCSLRIWFKDDPETMFPIYKRLRAHGLHILLYSGDTDACVPSIGTRYALASMGLDIIEPWHSWSISNTTEVAGFKVVYHGITYATVFGAGHEVSKSHPHRLFYLLNNFTAMVDHNNSNGSVHRNHPNNSTSQANFVSSMLVFGCLVLWLSLSGSLLSLCDVILTM